MHSIIVWIAAAHSVINGLWITINPSHSYLLRTFDVLRGAKDASVFNSSWQENLLRDTTLQRTLKSMTIYTPEAGNYALDSHNSSE